MPSQSVVTGTLEQSINSKSANVGDPFILDVQAPFPADDNRYSGAKVYGHVQGVTHASMNHKGVVQLATDRITLSDGTTASLNTTILSVDPQGNKANSTAKTIIGGAVGQVLGNYIGKHIGTNIGGAVGMIGGALYASTTGQNVTLPQGSSVSVKTTQPATVLSRRQAGYPNNNGNYNNNYPSQNPTPYPTPYH